MTRRGAGETLGETPWAMAPVGEAAALAARMAAVVPAIVTERLRLRAPRIADFEAYAEIATTERGAHIGGPMSLEAAWLDFAQMAAGWLLHGHGLWSVERSADGRLLGFVVLGFEPGDREPELGFLLRVEAEGRGYAHEAAVAARGYAFGTLGMHALVSYVAPGNLRSIRLAERLGAHREAKMVEDVLVFRHVAGPGERR